MPNYFKRHIPNYARDLYDEPELKIPFNNLNELLELEHVKLMHAVQLRGNDFYRFSQTDNNRLMAEYDQGFHWLVVGYLDESVEGLPEWKSRYRTKERGEISSEEVYSTCGDKITLRDGTILTDSSR